MKTIIWTLFVLTILSSCVTQKKCNRKFSPVTETKTEYIEKIETDTIVLKPDSIVIEREVPCDDFEIISENKTLKYEISVLKGKMISKVSQKVDTVYLPSKTITETKYEKEIVTIKECRKYVQVLAWIGAGLILILITILVMNVKKAGSLLTRIIK